jgi:arsenate reductase
MYADEPPLAEQRPGGRPIRYVLFVCNHNAGRSQMAQAFLERHGPDDVRAESAGTEPEPDVWPPVVEAMREVGIDLAGRKPRKLTLEMQLHADWAVTMGCGDACPYVPTIVEAWDVADPAGKSIAEVRAIRDEIEQHVRVLIGDRLDAIRTDRTAHQLRLQRLLPMLADEFAATKPPEEIRACADAVLARFEGARVRTHILTLAYRQTRECLSKDVCDLLEDRRGS